MIRFVLVTASILLIGAQGEPERDPNREVASLDSLKYNAQPRYGGYGYNGYPSMGYPSYPGPSMGYPSYPGYPAQPAMNYPIGGSSYYPNYGYPNTGYYPQPAVMEPSPSKPDYNKPTDVSDTGATVVDDEEEAANNLPNWGDQNYGGWEYGLPNWSNSYTPMPGQGGCYNRCRPKCFQPQPPPFQPPRPPMPPIMPPPRIPPKPM